MALPGKLGERTHPCVLFAASCRECQAQCMTSHPPDVEALMAEGRKRMLSASPPDPPPRRYPTLTRLGLVQRWAVLEIPAGDQLRTEMGTSRWFLGGHLLSRSSSSKRMGLQAQRWRASSESTLGTVLEVFTPKELRRSGLHTSPQPPLPLPTTSKEPGRRFYFV